MASAAAQSKLLLVYLHADLHQDSEAFAEKALATEAFERFCRSRFVLWGADVASADGLAGVRGGFSRRETKLHN